MHHNYSIVSLVVNEHTTWSRSAALSSKFIICKRIWNHSNGINSPQTFGDYDILNMVDTQYMSIQDQVKHYGLVFKMAVQKGCDEAHPSMGTYVMLSHFKRFWYNSLTSKPNLKGFSSPGVMKPGTSEPESVLPAQRNVLNERGRLQPEGTQEGASIQSNFHWWSVHLSPLVDVCISSFPDVEDQWTTASITNVILSRYVPKP